LLISRIELDLNKYNTRRAISVPQVLHAAVEGCFPDKTDKERKLWRLDRLYGSLYLLLLSREKPIFEEFARQFCYEDVAGETKDYTILLSTIRSGAKYRFRLRANPTHSVPLEMGVRGKIYPHITIEQKRNWLLKKTQNCGFKLNELCFDVVETDYLRFWRKGTARPVELSIAVYEGELEVSDRELFVKSLIYGIGRAKAYGCGMLTVEGIR